MAESIEMRVKARKVNFPDSEDGITVHDIPDSYLPIDRSAQTSVLEILAPLDGMVGLDHVKEHLLSLARIKKLDSIRNENSFTMRTKYLEHYLFLGNPGTGKTTTARLMSEMLFRLGVLKTRNVVEVSAVDMIAGYVGQTPEKTRQVIEKATDGVLFIDEAYTLLPGGRDGMTGYGREVIDTLVKGIDDFKDRIVVIMAGYPSEMLELIQSNPGLMSRFTKMIYFPDFNENQLGEILTRLCEIEKYRITDVVLGRAIQQLQQVKAISPRTFGNAREVERLYRHMIQNLANRIVTDPSTLNHLDELPPNWNVFQPSDVDGYEVISDQTMSWENQNSVKVINGENSRRRRL